MCGTEESPQMERIKQSSAADHHGANRVWRLRLPRYLTAKTNKPSISTLQKNVTYSLQDSDGKTNDQIYEENREVTPKLKRKCNQ